MSKNRHAFTHSFGRPGGKRSLPWSMRSDTRSTLTPSINSDRKEMYKRTNVKNMTIDMIKSLIYLLQFVCYCRIVHLVY